LTVGCLVRFDRPRSPPGSTVLGIPNTSTTDDGSDLQKVAATVDRVILDVGVNTRIT